MDRTGNEGTARLLAGLRPEAAGVPRSGIVEVFRHGFGRPGLIPLWAGEGDRPTPAFICEAAARSMAAGETFYSDNAGQPSLRAALARYHDRVYGSLFGRPFPAERFVVTLSGMQAIQLALTLIAGPGDEVILPTPAWPNFGAAIGVRGARPVEVPLTVGADGTALDLDRVKAAIGPATRAIVVNTPSNPTGWTADSKTLEGLLDLSRSTGVWLLADEIYGRFHHAGEGPAPSLHALIRPDDRVIFVNTFSKNWAMTGWRLGWLELPQPLVEPAVALIQFATSGTPVFLQRAGEAALEAGEAFLDDQVATARRGLDLMAAALAATGRVRMIRPDGAFYLFFSVEGIDDCRALAMRLIDEIGVGLAPGRAFGAAGNGYLRACCLRSEAQLSEAAGRLAGWIGRL